VRLLMKDPGQFAVVDEFLPREEVAPVWQHVQGLTYSPPPHWVRVWRANDGQPLASAPIRSDEAPTGSVLDDVLARIVRVVKEDHPDIIPDWNFVLLRSYLYRVGTRISWHNDAAKLGAVVLFTHPVWSAHWGGELMVAERPGYEELSEEERRQVEANEGVHFDRHGVDLLLSKRGHGRYFSPLPNRAIISTTGVWHATNRVDPSAGDTLRCSLVAFFHS
jgi:hypothetical protein